MLLHKAMRTAAKFAAPATKKFPALYQAVLLIPGVGEGDRAQVFATDGLHGCLVYTEDSVPGALVGMDAVRFAAKHKLASVDREGNELTFRTQEGGTFRVQAKDAIAYPRPPSSLPEMVEYPYWNHVWPIVHAAAEDRSKQPTFKHVRFRPTCVEATDAARVAVADVPGCSQDRVIPARLLRGWKDGRVRIGFSDKLVFAARDDEIRFAPLNLEISFPNCKKHLPDEHELPALVVATDELCAVVEKALLVSPLKTIALTFGGAELVVKSWNGDEGGKGFRAALRVNATQPEVKSVKIFNGKLLAQMLKAVRTPNVRLCYQESTDSPLRLESGAMVEGLWPWRT